MYKKFTAPSMMALCAAVGASQVQALEPAVIKAGAFELTPALTLEQRYDNNIFSQPEDEKESWVTVLAPSIQAAADLGTVEVLMGYQHSAGLYEASSDDNFNDNTASAAMSWEPNHRNQLDLTATYNDSHEDRGTGFSQGSGADGIEEPDTYEDITLDAEYVYGSETSPGRLVFNVTNYDKEYTNHRDLTKGRDREDLSGGVTFYWGVGGKTDVLLEAKQTDIDYNSDPDAVVGSFDTLDSTVTKYMAGVTWEATAKTTGIIKVGQAKKDFDDADRKDFSGTSWEAEVQWAPKTYSMISLNTAREPRETNGVGSFIDAETYGVSWQHSWTDRVTSNLFYNFTDETYKGAAVKREDELTAYGLRVDYSMRRWLDVGFSASYSEKDSTQNAFSYERNQVAMHLNVSM
ncbi:outer membrane beta-barrel protein [Aestuariicella hydrocarbonica]|uniref:Outer membrane beta-barrel protein n=1 Tax=Pseudomaricurvus hydrocarbonicus TaxID=1470433 RepID=A0A9E5MQK1_9GAMM|nr:outer membrane beta-barrel protein [Aestuariicella hydrocarbonica]NHO68519.1 outer membrane beta-barrel protein [Aestuariicella hydrocarbonica]